MYPGGYTAEVTNLSPRATERDVQTFFSYCVAIDHFEVTRSGEHASTAYVTFRGPYALETALLLDGSLIVDQCVCVSRWGAYIDDCYNWNNHTSKHEDSTRSTDIHVGKKVSIPGEAVSMAQKVLKTMVAKGSVLGKDALVKAKAFDESYNVSSRAPAKVAELSNKIGLSNAINEGMETFKKVDQKYHITKITKLAASVTRTAATVLATVTGKVAVAAGNAVVHSSYFAKGALWVSDMLTRAAKVAADLGHHNNN